MATRTFYAIVLPRDVPVGHDEVGEPRGPLLIETYLNDEHASREAAQAIVDSRRFASFGDVRIATITIDLPEE